MVGNRFSVFEDRCHLFFASDRDVAPHLIKVEYPSQKYAFYHVWLKLSILIFVGRFVKVISGYF